MEDRAGLRPPPPQGPPGAAETGEAEELSDEDLVNGWLGAWDGSVITSMGYPVGTAPAGNVHAGEKRLQVPGPLSIGSGGANGAQPTPAAITQRLLDRAMREVPPVASQNVAMLGATPAHAMDATAQSRILAHQMRTASGSTADSLAEHHLAYLNHDDMDSGDYSPEFGTEYSPDVLGVSAPLLSSMVNGASGPQPGASTGAAAKLEQRVVAGDEDVHETDSGSINKEGDDPRSNSVAINRRYRRKVQNSIAELQMHLEKRSLCPFKRKLSRAEAATRSLSYIKSLEKNVECMRRACELAFVIQNPNMTLTYLRELYAKHKYDQRSVLHVVTQDLLHVFDFALAEMWQKQRVNGREELTYWFGVRRLCLSTDAESLLNMFEISSERMKFSPMEGLPGRALSMRQSQYLPTATDTGQFLRAKQAAKAGLQSGYAFPIMNGDDVTAVSVFLSSERRDFNFVLFNSVQAFFGALSSLQREFTLA